MGLSFLPGIDCCGGTRVMLAVVIAAGVALGVGACIVRGDDAGDGAYELQILSGRPDMVTGGDALVSIAAGPDADLSDLRITLGGRDVTAAFRPSSPGVLVGLVEGLSGSGELLLASADGTPRGSLSLVNHPVEGPVFSGPHEQPFVCETEAFELQWGETLGAPLDSVRLHAPDTDASTTSTDPRTAS